MHHNRVVAVSALVAGSLSLGVLGAAPALADAGSYGSLAPGQVGFAGASGALTGSGPLTPFANSVSNTFGGWVFGTTGNTSVTSTFTMPRTIKCTPTTSGPNSGVGPGSFMLTQGPTTQEFNGAGVLIECVNGRPTAAADAIVNSNETLDPNTKHLLFGGDLIKSTVVTASTKTVSTVSDLTHKFTYSKSGPGGAAINEFVIDDSIVITTSPGHGKQLPMANFGQIPFAQGAVGGKALGVVPKRGAFDMKTKATVPVLQIQTSALTGTAKNAFNTVFKHS